MSALRGDRQDQSYRFHIFSTRVPLKEYIIITKELNKYTYKTGLISTSDR